MQCTLHARAPPICLDGPGHPHPTSLLEVETPVKAGSECPCAGKTSKELANYAQMLSDMQERAVEAIDVVLPAVAG